MAMRVAVVGAGIIGASIAWNLAKRGAAVTIFAAGEAGGVATPNTFGWINASWGNPLAYFRLRQRSMAEWKNLAADVPGVPLAWPGGLCWDLPAAELEAYLGEHGAWGYDLRRVDRAEASAIEPALLDPPDVALFAAEEGMVEAVPATRALVADAVRRGAVFMAGANVTRLSASSAGAVVHTSRGDVETDRIVLAAGAATPVLAETAGVAVPMITPPGLIVHSRPCCRLLNGVVISRGPHMRQTAEGRVIAGSNFGGSDPGDDPAETARALFAEVQSLLRGGAGMELDFHTIGHRPTPVDGYPAVGHAAGVGRLYVALTHSGVTLAPAIGLLAAEEILSGRRDPLLEPHGLSRFGQG